MTGPSLNICEPVHTDRIIRGYVDEQPMRESHTEQTGLRQWVTHIRRLATPRPGTNPHWKRKCPNALVIVNFLRTYVEPIECRSSRASSAISNCDGVKRMFASQLVEIEL
jgi:hypothetical protein